MCEILGIELPETFQTGGIIGVAEIVDCITDSDNDWFEGPYGFVLDSAREIPFVPCKGKLGLFETSQEIG
jgi:hypothetical protein